MSTAGKTKRNELLETITHYLTAFVVLMKGFDKLTTPGKTGVGILFLGIDLFIFAGTIFHHKFERLLRHFKAYTFGLEAIVVFIIGYLLIKEGKTLIPYAYFFASVMFVVALIVYLRKVRANS